MVGPLLETKLYRPRPRRSLVARPRLRERLDRGAEGALTLVAAPPGFGKTTLLAEWLAATSAEDRSLAWLSLDQGDNQPSSFWAYLIAALRTALPGVGAGALTLLESAQPPPTEAVLATLLNELGALPRDIVLVLDDYHAIDAREIHEGMAFLLDHSPPTLHLVLASRADPVLPLARLRARGDLVEIRAADLRFTAEEAAAFLNEAMGLNLAVADVAALEARTEGWIAGLQLAALSLQDRPDAAGFIRAFAGDDRYILDYLVEEVLRRQPDDVRSFLLHTAILDRLSGPLCDAVTGRGDGSEALAELERGNLFVVPLDDKRHWYRYHHLFADVLRAHLRDEQPGHIPDLHRRASAWFAQHDLPVEAIRHALAAEDFPQAADLIERALAALRRGQSGVAVLGWLKALPDEVISTRPVLSVVYAWALLAGGDYGGVETRLRDAERWLDATTRQPDDTPQGIVVANQEEFRRLPATIAIYRAAQAQAAGDQVATATHARRALDLVPEDDHLRRGAAAGFLGIASWASGDLDAAHRHYAAGMASLERAGHVADVIDGAVILADIRTAQGRLRDAERTLEQAVQRAAERGKLDFPRMPDLLVSLSELRRERNDLLTAIQHLHKSQEMATRTGRTSRWCAAMAWIKAAQGDLDGALALLDEAERRYVRDYAPDACPIAAQRARVWVAQGRLSDALAWARERGLSAEDDLSYLREYEHLTLARIRLAREASDRAQRSSQTALNLLSRLLPAAETGGRMASVIECLVLQALGHQARGDLAAALMPLERALALGEPEGYVRVFADEGAPMATLLAVAAKRATAPEYTRRLQAAFGKPEESTPAKQDLIEPLSERELAVLRLLGTDLDGPEIAHELMVSLNTMRTHTKNIYAKLGVNNRRAAVRRAEELALFSRPRKH
jgi:LuxR family maltose regulon positive regulatory protein